MRKIKEKFFCTLVLMSFVLSLATMVAHAESVAKDGVTMDYDLSLSKSKWKAYTFCATDMDSKVSLFLYKSKGGELLYSDIKYGRTRETLPGTSLSGTYAALSETKKTAKYGRSVHALVYHDTNWPYISAKELTQSK